MKVNFFIDHPVFSMVISILIVIVGFIGLTLLPIDQYPQITPPVVKISASYPGASATTVTREGSRLPSPSTYRPMPTSPPSKCRTA